MFSIFSRYFYCKLLKKKLQYFSSSRSNRSEVVNSSRSNPATERSMETCRTYMDTARVHTALAALGAEKQALLAKLQAIDSALEVGDKKRAAQSRPRK